MKFAKLPEQPIVEMKSKHKLPKGDPASKATTSVDGTDKKEDTKAQELKNGVPKTEDPKKGQPKKDDQKKEEVKQGNEPVVHKTADTIVRRVLKSDEPKKIFIMPQEKILLEECQPLSLTSPVQTNYETFKTKSKFSGDTFTVFTLVMQELRDYFDIHAKALEIINLNANHAEIKMIQNARYNGVYDVMNASYPGFSSPINWPVCKCRPQQPSLAYDELKRLRASSSKANEKRLLELLEAQHEEMANLLHAEGLNYFYWYKTFVPVEQAVLPGESFGDACKRVFSSHDRSTELGDLMALVHNSPHPNEKLPKAKILPAPKTSKEKKEKDSNEKDSKDKKPKKA
ncbi:unnamed protein product [Caenorhabditis auriculariae]|uniref:Uncharacterized protein n=1 Tax=Caenorhabditis auriculariae TaxID=2777116 RepID=A0A8S1HTI9_9PELO|nr:unnamed protein product [Caenorhabditis auriculariae]